MGILTAKLYLRNVKVVEIKGFALSVVYVWYYNSTPLKWIPVTDYGPEWHSDPLFFFPWITSFRLIVSPVFKWSLITWFLYHLLFFPKKQNVFVKIQILFILYNLIWPTANRNITCSTMLRQTHLHFCSFCLLQICNV